MSVALNSSNENLPTPSQRTEIIGVNDRVSRKVFLHVAIVSICGFAGEWGSVIAYKEDMSYVYALFRYFGIFGIYCYVRKLVSLVLSSESPNLAPFKLHKVFLISLLYIVSATMFLVSHLSQRLDVFVLAFCAIFASIALLQLNYPVEGFGIFYIFVLAVLGSASGIWGLYIKVGVCVFAYHIINIFAWMTDTLYEDKIPMEENFVVYLKMRHVVS